MIDTPRGVKNEGSLFLDSILAVHHWYFIDEFALVLYAVATYYLLNSFFFIYFDAYFMLSGVMAYHILGAIIF